jgi:hypothetical protein
MSAERIIQEATWQFHGEETFHSDEQIVSFENSGDGNEQTVSFEVASDWRRTPDRPLS